MITHNPAAAKYGDSIIHMRDGRSFPNMKTRVGGGPEGL